MRKTLLAALLLAFMGLNAQNYHINLHHSGSVVYDNDINTISDIRFQGSQPANMLINGESGTMTFPLTAFDSITFVKQEEPPQPPAGDTVYITYDGSSVEVINPFSNNGVTVSTSSANVTVNSTMVNVPYVVSGTSSNGSFTIYSTSPFYLALNSLSLTSTSAAAINLASNVNTTLALRGTSTLADGANSSLNAALYAAGNLTIGGSGTMRITGNAKHGIAVEGTTTVNSGTITILDTDSDGIHGSSNLIWNGGNLDIVSAGSDGLDFSGTMTINNGDLTINTTAESQRSIKVTNAFTMTGGALHLIINGNDCKGIKGDADINISGPTSPLSPRHKTASASRATAPSTSTAAP